jgi:thermostable 8-oxoguanine DNA glycosylase
MIDPKNIPDNMTLEQRQEFALFAIAVAGHNALATARSLGTALSMMFHRCESNEPFIAVQQYSMEEIASILSWCGIGCHKSKARSFHEIARSSLNLYTCTPEEMETIYGIGPKTSRFFIMYSRPEETNEYAVFDVHVLRWMNQNGIPAPASTPASARYRQLEQAFLQAARERGVSARALDEQIWKEATSER